MIFYLIISLGRKKPREKNADSNNTPVQNGWQQHSLCACNGIIEKNAKRHVNQIAFLGADIVFVCACVCLLSQKQQI